MYDAHSNALGYTEILTKYLALTKIKLILRGL